MVLYDINRPAGSAWTRARVVEEGTERVPFDLRFRDTDILRRGSTSGLRGDGFTFTSMRSQE